MTTSQTDTVTQVASVLLNTRRIGHAVIELEDDDGTVTLKGMVESEDDKINAGALVQEMEGVSVVVNKLSVSQL